MPIISEANFDVSNAINSANSLLGSGVTGKASDYSVEVLGTRLENKLHQYASYTYRITLFFLTSKDYNSLSSNPSSFQPKYSLISSAGGYATSMSTLVAQETQTGSANYDQTLRHPDFQTDFFIDNLSLQTIVGLNAKTKASNAVDITFTITEPYGLSLLDRLLSACETSDDASVNYMSQPYLLQLDILANATEENTSKLTSNNVIDRKRIAIKLIEMKIKPSGSGTTYAVRAMPYNHSAFDTTTASLPVTMTVESGTVGEFFSSTDDIVKDFSGISEADEERLEGEIDRWINENYSTGGRKPTAEEIERQKEALKQGIIFNNKSLAAAYNNYMDSIKDKKLALQPPTKIAFSIPNDEMRKSLIVNPIESSNDNVSMQNPATGYNKSNPNFKRQQPITLNAGTSIIDVIDMIMSRSDYVKKQIETQKSKQNESNASDEYTNGSERSGDTQEPKKLKWYKILPTVSLKDFDPSTNTYSKTVLYNILPYNAANAYHPNFPKIDSSNVADAVVRTYDYLYTGLNQDIIKFDVDFDTSFYTLVTTKGEQVKRIASDAGSDESDVDKNEQKYSNTTSTATIPPVVKAFAGSDKSAVGTTKATSPDEQIVSDMKGSLYSRQRGDGLNIKLNIVGDPAFIKQDDIFVNAGSPEEYNKFITSRLANNSMKPIAEDGQILFDAEQVYVQVNVKNAVDIDNNLGIVNKQDTLSNGRTTDGTFSGIYKVLTVQSEFNRGQFTQTLDLIRIPDAIDSPKKSAQNQGTATKSVTNDTVDKDAEAKRNIFANPIVPTQTSPGGLPGIINQGTVTI